jgi:hypothetical protein
MLIGRDEAPSLSLAYQVVHGLDPAQHPGEFDLVALAESLARELVHFIHEPSNCLGVERFRPRGQTRYVVVERHVFPSVLSTGSLVQEQKLGRLGSGLRNGIVLGAVLVEGSAHPLQDVQHAHGLRRQRMIGHEVVEGIHALQEVGIGNSVRPLRVQHHLDRHRAPHALVHMVVGLTNRDLLREDLDEARFHLYARVPDHGYSEEPQEDRNHLLRAAYDDSMNASQKPVEEILVRRDAG